MVSDGKSCLLLVAWMSVSRSENSKKHLFSSCFTFHHPFEKWGLDFMISSENLSRMILKILFSFSFGNQRMKSEAVS